MTYYCSTLDGRVGFMLDDYRSHQVDLKASLVEVFLGKAPFSERLVVSYDKPAEAKAAAREISDSIDMQSRTKRDHELALAEQKAQARNRREDHDE